MLLGFFKHIEPPDARNTMYRVIAMTAAICNKNGSGNGNVISATGIITKVVPESL